MNNRFSYLLFLFCYAFCLHINGQTSISIDDLQVNYTEEEMDSLAKTLKQYFYDGKYEKVVEITPQLIEYAKEKKLFKKENSFRSVLGNTFIQLDDIESTITLFNEGLDRAREAQDTLAMSSSYINLGNTFLTNEPERAIPHFKNAIKLSEKKDNYQGLFISYNNLSELYVGIKKPAEAQEYLNKAHLLLEKEILKDWKEEYASVLMHTQGAIYLQKQNYKDAITTIEASLEVGKDKFDENYLVRNYANLMEAYENVGNFKKVNEIRHLHEALIKKRNETEKLRQQKIATSRYNLDRYRQELRASQLENELAIQKAAKNNLLLKTSFGIAAILLMLLGFLLFIRKKRNKLLRDLKLKNKQYLEAKERSEKLAKSNTKFLSTISHELRTPLYGIIGLSSVFLKDPKLKDHSDDLKSLKFSADYLLALVNDVLNLNKFSSKEGERIHKTNFRLKKLVTHIVQSFEFINKKNNNELTIEIDPEIPEILLGDKTKISQVLMNLVSNASKFTEYGHIIVKAQIQKKDTQKATVLFSVADTGQGIREEEQTNIFKEFTQVENFTDEQGTGLGLPIVNKILNLLGSKLSLESSLGKGSTFSFNIILDIGSEDHLDISTDISGYDKLKNKNILIVDDNKINQVVTQKVLEQYGMLHTTAGDGKEAIAVAQSNTFDAILMDINMPVMNGIDASNAIRNFDKHTPIIALTATNYKNGTNELNDYGINDSIIKPYKTEDLLKTLLEQIF